MIYRFKIIIKFVKIINNSLGLDIRRFLEFPMAVVA